MCEFCRAQIVGKNFICCGARETMTNTYVTIRLRDLNVEKRNASSEEDDENGEKTEILFESTSSCASTASGLLPSLIHFNS